MFLYVIKSNVLNTGLYEQCGCITIVNLISSLPLSMLLLLQSSCLWLMHFNFRHTVPKMTHFLDFINYFTLTKIPNYFIVSLMRSYHCNDPLQTYLKISKLAQNIQNDENEYISLVYHCRKNNRREFEFAVYYRYNCDWSWKYCKFN